MDTIPTKFTTIDSTLCHQIEEAERRITLQVQRTIEKIRKARHRAAISLKKRGERLRVLLESDAAMRLEHDLRLQGEKARQDTQAALENLHKQAQAATLRVLHEVIGSDSELRSQAILRRLTLLFTQLGHQRNLTISFNPADITSEQLHDFCNRHQLTPDAADDCLPGDFLIALPAGTIESTLHDDIEHLLDNFAPICVDELGITLKLQNV